MIQVPPLPYSYTSLEPYLSERTLRAHHEGHLANYIRTVNELVGRVPALAKRLSQLPEGEQLAFLVQYARTKSWQQLYDAAAQAANHIFYFRCMRPQGGGPPTDPRLAAMLAASFGSWEQFSERWNGIAKAVFGSGWVWLVTDGRQLQIVPTKDAGIPSSGLPLVVMDVWEHAYYLDYTFHRGEYSGAFLEHLVAWPELG